MEWKLHDSSTLFFFYKEEIEKGEGETGKVIRAETKGKVKR